MRRVVLRMWQCMMQRELVTNQLKPKKLSRNKDLANHHYISNASLVLNE